MIVSGRDMQQNELLVKRYMRKGDIYVHATLQGASSCIIKNPTGAPVPPVTLSQAGTMTVCRSAAWAAKVVTSAYWVYDDQVSKTAPTGEYLTTGSFMIRGKKNFLPPNPLVMGLAVLFKLDESCLAKHIEDRKVKLEDADFDKYGLTNEPDKEPSEDIKEKNKTNEPEEKKLRKFERTKLKKEHKDKEDIEKDLPITEIEPSENASSSETIDIKEVTDTPTAISTVVVSAELDIDEKEEKSPAGEVKRKAKLSAAQRKKLKQGIPLDQQVPTQKQAPQPKAPIEKPLPKQQVRGKKGKIKKIKEKYKDQDEEERKLRMEILAKGGVIELSSEDSDDVAEPEQQNTTSELQKEHTSSAEGAEKEKEKIEEKEKEEIEGVVQNENVDSDSDDMDVETPEKISRRKAKREAKEKEAAEIKKLLADENVLALANEAMDKLNEIDALTGTPLPDDILLFAMAVCAPYSAIQNYKYKVKLTPGSMKKGKAAKLALDMFTKTNPDITAREKDLIKHIGENETVQVIMPDAKVSTPGLFKNTKGKNK